MSVSEKFNRWWAANYPPDWWADKTIPWRASAGGEPLPVEYRKLVRDLASDTYVAGYVEGRMTAPFSRYIQQGAEVRIALDVGLDKATAKLNAIKHYEAIEREWPHSAGFKYDKATGIATVIED